MDKATDSQIWRINNDLAAYLYCVDREYCEKNFPWKKFKELKFTKKQASILLDWLHDYMREGGKEPDKKLTMIDIEKIVKNKWR